MIWKKKKISFRLKIRLYQSPCLIHLSRYQFFYNSQRRISFSFDINYTMKTCVEVPTILDGKKNNFEKRLIQSA